MKKIVFANISMQPKLIPNCFKGESNVSCNYEGKVVYAINAFLADHLKKDDDVKVVLIQTEGHTDAMKQRAKTNTDLFENELNDINKKIGANITYVTISSDFNEAKKEHEKRIMTILEQMEKGAELYGDITFGPRTIPMILLCAFSFAEKYYDAHIMKIIYGKIEFGENGPEAPEIYDLTSLYYLNSLTYNLKVDSLDKAMNSLKAFFSL